LVALGWGVALAQRLAGLTLGPALATRQPFLTKQNAQITIKKKLKKDIIDIKGSPTEDKKQIQTINKTTQNWHLLFLNMYLSNCFVQ
jgi:hypothetical protein